MHIGILSQWYDPEPGPARLPGALARSLASRGHKVTVLTGFPNYPHGTIYPGYKQSWNHEEVSDGVRVRRVPLYPSHGTSAAGRVGNYLSFAGSAVARGASALDGVDALWVSNSPPTVALPMWRAVRRTGAPVLLHILDLWPDNVVSSELLESRGAVGGVVSAVHRWNRSMYASADHIATISPGTVDVLAGRGVPRTKLSYIPMWANETDFHPHAVPTLRKTRGVPEDRVVVLYAGTIGRAQAIDALVRAAELYSPQAPPIEIWIAGSGVEETAIRSLADRVNRPNVTVAFLGRFPGDEMAEVMASADLHYVGLRSDANSSITMPSKLQATMAAAKPILIAVGGDAEGVVVGAKAGFAASPGQPESIAMALQSAARAGRPHLEKLGANARRAYERDFSLQAGTDRVEAVLTDLVERRRR